ncbi:hypothetical protein MMC16_007514 [Acarospora aff. strigata]|nr:hypothetical protein [Acarospora aff. strigata]
MASNAVAIVSDAIAIASEGKRHQRGRAIRTSDAVAEVWPAKASDTNAVAIASNAVAIVSDAVAILSEDKRHQRRPSEGKRHQRGRAIRTSDAVAKVWPARASERHHLQDKRKHEVGTLFVDNTG